MKVCNIAESLNALLRVSDFVPYDLSLNGLQVGDGEAEVRKAVFAVDACERVFSLAAAAHAQLLVVHHGLFWGKPLAVTGAHYKRIRTLLDNGLALYACHLPLDAHPVYGNNARIAQALGLEETEAFAPYRGVKIGIKGVLPRPVPLDEVPGLLGLEPAVVLPFGKKSVRTVGIVSGGAADEVSYAMDEGLDLYITGESSHQTYHPCEEGGINMLCFGHYATETFGVRALMEVVSGMGIETSFIDAPTGL